MDSPHLPTRIGKYEILGVIGRGGMGMVYRGRDPHIDRTVAVKTIRVGHDQDEENHRERLRMEARSAGKLQHPNIVTIYDYGEDGDVSFIAMEFVEGSNLSRVVQKGIALSLATKLDLLIQVARGLAYAHECGVIHRDLKPSNICVTTRGVAKILDFGLARLDNTRLTRTGYLSGTVAYMSPERFSGDTGPQDDIFALGAVAYELLTYRRAFPGDTTPEVMSKILSGTMPAAISTVAGYPPELDEIIEQAIARDGVDRYSSASELEDALVQFTRTDAYLQFAAAEARRPEFQQKPVWSDDTVQTGNPYSSSRSMPVAPPEAPTEIAAAPADPTLLATKPAPQRADYSTQLADFSTRAVPVSPPRSRKVFGIAAAIVVVAAIGGGLAMMLMREPAAVEQAETVVAATTVAPQSATNAATPATTTPLATSSAPELNQILETTTVAAKPAPEPPRKRREKAAAPAPAKVETMSQPAPVVVVPAPAPAPQPPPAPAGPTRAERENEIRALIRDMAVAYQTKDVAFFRARMATFSPEIAAAIRNSPSVRVDMNVGAIDLNQESARVAVQRTDRFAEANIPPAVQNLVYELRRRDDGWQIVDVYRR
ncbi:MAG TPA: serine/threonine-protein kinase [Thermoanaerobaculia bacterium]